MHPLIAFLLFHILANAATELPAVLQPQRHALDTRKIGSHYQFNLDELPDTLTAEQKQTIKQFYLAGGLPLMTWPAPTTDRWANFTPDANGNGGVIKIIRVLQDGTFIEGELRPRLSFPNSEIGKSQLIEFHNANFISNDPRDMRVELHRTYRDPDGNYVRLYEAYKLETENGKVTGQILTSLHRAVATENDFGMGSDFKVKVELYTRVGANDNFGQLLAQLGMVPRLPKRAPGRELSGLLSQHNEATGENEFYSIAKEDLRDELPGDILDFVMSRDYRHLQILTEKGWTTYKVILIPSETPEKNGLVRFEYSSGPRVKGSVLRCVHAARPSLAAP